MYEKFLEQGLSGEELQACMNLEYKEKVKSLLKKADWKIRDDVMMYQSHTTPHLWNIYDGEPAISRPTCLTFNALTEELQPMQ
ncbi:MAG: hypothetical protein R3Y63_14330 [Eubacteriales bacterium]